ncbi:MAG: DUF2911 domain-containing protein [Gemmatimonadota bacterium]
MLFHAIITAAFLTGTPAPTPGTAASPCVRMEDEVPVAGRQSRLDSVSIRINNKEIKVCYGRPSLKGRVMLGGEAVPFGKLWRTGANEPTMIHTDLPLTIAGIRVEPGTYSLYTVPGASEWEIIVNRAIKQWGHESTYTPEVKAQEVGRGKVKPTTLTMPVETFAISLTPPADGKTSIVLDWQATRVSIPVTIEAK